MGKIRIEKEVIDMRFQNLLDEYIRAFSQEINIRDKKEQFILLINCFLISKLRTQKNNGDDILRKVYPYILNDDIDYDSENALAIIDFFSKNNRDDDILGYIYESSLNTKDRKDYGQFYTHSKDVVNYMVNLIDNYNNQKILEPSSGSGVFLIEIIRRKLDMVDVNNVKEIEKTLLDIFTNFYTNDIDSFACKITEANILVSTIDYIKIVYDTNNSFILPRLNISNIDFCNYKNVNKFDLVISNPPYVTMYGKRSRNMTEEKRKQFNTFDFVINKKGNNKFNMIMFFLENGIKSLKENGKLIFILDISFFETAFIDIRKYLLENCYIESITTNMNEFENVASGQMVISLVKSKNHGLTIWHDYKENTKISIDQSIWYNDNNQYKIYVPLSDIERNINDKVNKFDSLEKYYPNKCLRTCCALTGKTEEFIVNKNKKTNNLVFPFLEGSKGLSKKFGLLNTSKYIEYNYQLQLDISNQFKEELEKIGVKNKKRVTLGDKEAYLSPKLFIRQSANDIIATYTDKPYAANNSLYILSDKNNSKESIFMLKYVCGILNSDLITFYSRINNIIRRGNGKTPQIKTLDLKRIKIAVNNSEYQNIINIVDSLLINDNCYDEYYNMLNETIYKIYGINKEEINYINSFFKKR